MTVFDHQVADLVDSIRSGDMFGEDFDPVAFRMVFEELAPQIWPRDDLRGVVTRDLLVPAGESKGLPARLYLGSVKAPAPLLLFMHGGGFVSGSLETADSHCRFLAQSAECLVLSLAYRLAPESPFPTPGNDVYTAAQWLVQHAVQLGADPQRLAIGGDAPGATLANVAALRLAEAGTCPFRLQFLLGPACDFEGAYPEKLAKLMLGPVSLAALEAMESLNLPNASDRKSWHCSPIFCPHLDRSPTTFIMAAEHDFLRPETDVYVANLRRAGVEVVYQVWPGAVHNFFSFRQLDIAKLAMANAAFQLRRALSLA